MAKSEAKDKIVAVLRKEQGLDKFQIAAKSNCELAEAQEILRNLQEKREIISGLEKLEGTSNYERRYYLMV